MSDAEARGPAILQPVNGSSSRRSRGGITASAAVSSSNVAVATAANSAGGAQGKQFKTQNFQSYFRVQGCPHVFARFSSLSEALWAQN